MSYAGVLRGVFRLRVSCEAENWRDGGWGAENIVWEGRRQTTTPSVFESWRVRVQSPR
jgi:hypothetical protein